MSEDTAHTRLELERRDDGVRVLTLADPDKRNAIGPEMRDELVAVGRALLDDAQARVLVVAGQGSAFCAGADLSVVFDAGDTNPSALRDRELAFYESFLPLRELAIPTISAVQGAAVGAGLNLALVCDIVIAGPRARFGLTFSRLGLHPGGGCTAYVTGRIGPGRALRSMLLGEMIEGSRAVEIGLADELAEDPLTAALELATHVATLEPSLVRDMKRAVGIATTDSFEAVLAFEAYAQSASAFNPGVIDGIRAAGRSTRR